ncbi:MAG: right-handed parallel beta-helix repeat-containing protein [Dokdonella sp.]
MNMSSPLHLKPLAACLAAALAIVPAGALLADPAHPLASPRPAHAIKRSHVAQLLATSSGLTRKGLSLRQVMEEAAASARAARPAPADRPAGVVAVTSCDDAGPGTLRDAVANAVSGDVVDLSGLSCSSISLTTGAINVTVDSLSIQGPGASTLAIDAGGLSGVINHYGTDLLAIDGLTIANGYTVGYAYHGGACVLSSANIDISNSTLTHCYAYTAHAYGGAVCAVGNITLSNTTLSGNTTKGHFYYYYLPGNPTPYLINGTSFGGGAYAGGHVTISDSTITHNTAVQNNRGSVGGGVASRLGGNLISGSTFDNNTAWIGGGIAALGPYSGDTGGVSVVNSTISGNSTTNTSGGILTYRMTYTTLHNSTITNNFAPYCGGAYVYYGETDIKSSIISGNRSTYASNQFGYYTAADFDIFSSDATVSGDHNLVMTTNTPLPADTLTADPLLLPLADNGGPTLTHAFDMTSVALDAGSNPDNLDNDQRGAGFPRVTSAAADIGAYEAPGAASDVIFSDGFD